MLFLGIDPGSRHTGWGVVAGEGSRLELRGDGRLDAAGDLPLPSRLVLLSRGIDELLDQFQPDVAAVETPFAGMNARSLIVLAQARGAILATLARREIEIAEYTPAEVKAAVAGSGRAQKSEVARMLERQLRMPSDDRRSSDATDAIAIALCCARRFRMDRLRAAAGVR